MTAVEGDSIEAIDRDVDPLDTDLRMRYSRADIGYTEVVLLQGAVARTLRVGGVAEVSYGKLELWDEHGQPVERQWST